MSSPEEIANKALLNIGTSKRIGLFTEKSKEADVCALFYPQCVKQVLSDFPWPFATKFLALALVSNNPTIEWLYSYRYPSDCLTLRRVLNGLTTSDTSATRVPMKEAQDASGGLIYTNMQSAQVEYTALITDPARFPATFEEALGYRLAYKIAPSLTNGDPYKMAESCKAEYLRVISEAREEAANEEYFPQFPDSEMIAAREGLIPSRDGFQWRF